MGAVPFHDSCPSTCQRRSICLNANWMDAIVGCLSSILDPLNIVCQFHLALWIVDDWRFIYFLFSSYISHKDSLGILELPVS